MNTTSSKKTWIWVVGIVIVAGLIYFYLNSTATPSGGTLDASSPNVAIGTQVLGLLSQIQTLHIDTDLFNDPGYKTLRDYSVSIPPVNVGRPNPFAPLTGMVSTPVATSSGMLSNNAKKAH